jgi:putative cardiolipin synthase
MDTLKFKAALLLAISVFVLGGCATLPDRPPTDPVHAMTSAPSGAPAEVSSQFVEKHGADQSGFLALEGNREALMWRLALVDEATQSIDAQYFIFQNDESGNLLFYHLLKAADRGVRVRLLVDDMVFAPDDRTITAITMHPNFDIRIFNPGQIRGSKLGGLSEFLLNMKQLNRRMHNKLFIVDNRLAIVGGRNIGNEYFGLGKKYNFRDLDVLVAGEVVPELSEAFDDYWNVDLSYPGSAMSDKAKPGDIDLLREAQLEYFAGHPDMLASYPLEPRQWKEKMLELTRDLIPGTGDFLQDEPVLIGEDEYRLTDMLRYISEPSSEELTLVSPYFIPKGDMLERLAEISSKGVEAKVLTASMASNNHTAAHSHYKKYRRRIIGAGAELFEFKDQPSAEVRAITDVPPVEAKFISLHIKAIVADRERCFVGSLNLDPRAIELNTENGLYIESPGLCGELDAFFDEMMSPENAWKVLMDKEHTLWWESSSGTASFQPARSFFQRISDFFFRLIPIEGQL